MDGKKLRELVDSESVRAISYPGIGVHKGAYTFKTHDGLRGVHFNAEEVSREYARDFGLSHDSFEQKKNIVYLPTLGRFTHHPRHALLFSLLGNDTTFFSFAGTYGSSGAGDFLPDLDDPLSVQRDLSQVITSLYPDSEPVSLLALCFGGTIALAEAAANPKQVQEVYAISPMVFTPLNADVVLSDNGRKDKSRILGINLHECTGEYGPYSGTETPGWDTDVWVPLIAGRSAMNADRAVETIVSNYPVSNTQVHAFAARHDNLVSVTGTESLRTLFAEAIKKQHHPSTGRFQSTIVEDDEAGPGHFGHYLLEFSDHFLDPFCSAMGLDYHTVLPVKAKIDMNFEDAQYSQQAQVVRQVAEMHYGPLLRKTG